ncbi:endo-1,4-beta-xylanase [Halosquirtibacter xylanolyticus]|uniref:endo-1,4-beta-xylanase n=1 Tax=Halosquirtibacter xylanolyticus TaxID=3374599 RepID=UPI00374A2014|nr:endo-1,4-beta-xylanase [Prolixibacteraceae bacterium]
MKKKIQLQIQLLLVMIIGHVALYAEESPVKRSALSPSAKSSIVLAEDNPGSLPYVVKQKSNFLDLIIGSAYHERFMTDSNRKELYANFDYITPGNDFKQSYMHSKPGVYRFDKSDFWINECKKYNKVIRLHAPISPQCSKWVRIDNRTGGEMRVMMQEYMDTLIARYMNEPCVRWYDVVNETIDANTGDWFMDKSGVDKWENPWVKMGFDQSSSLKVPNYVIESFEIATQKCPNHVKLIINQHGAFERPVWNRMKKLVLFLRTRGFRVDGIGWQAHIDCGWEKSQDNISHLQEVIRWCHTNGLEFHITEFNVWLKNKTYSYQDQANTFAKVVKVVSNESKNGPVRINFWHMRKGETAKETFDGTPFFDNFTPKPAYYRMRKVLRNI